MILKIILSLLLVLEITAVTPFIEEGKRAKIFELTDNEIPIIRVTAPEEDFKNLLKEAQVPSFSLAEVFAKFNSFGNENNSNNEFDNNNGFGEQNTGKEFDNNGFGEQNAGNGFDDNGFGQQQTTGNDKIKNASMIVEINGEKKSFKKITFSLGGNSSRSYGRQGFNIKIRGGQDLYGRSQFRLRPDARDATYLRSKLACDIHNRLGLVSVSANYAILYVNDEYLGIYILMDAPKLSWVEKEFGEKNTLNLYNCKENGSFLTVESTANNCENENEEVTDNPEWINFLKTLDQATSAEDIEDIFDVDQFLYEAAYEYLSGAWDHLLHSGHNFVMYKPKNGKWTIIYYDFDADLGQDVVGIEFGQVVTNPNKDYPSYSFKQWMNVPFHILDILVFNDPTRFENILKKFVTEVFNPTVLFPHIDELKELIKPHVIKDKTPDENGQRPGVLNHINPVDYSIEEWEANSEFTTIFNKEVKESAYGLKYWILARYRYVCQAYNMECDPVYMDENYKYPIDKEVEGEINIHKWDGIDFSKFGGGFGGGFGGDNDSHQNPTTTITTTTTIATTTTTTVDPEETTTSQKYKCLSELAGYSCCAKGIKRVFDHDAYGDWGYDFSKKEWCGLTPYEETKDDDDCWSEVLGYPCCKGCYIYATDEDGQWGYEDNHWCGIQSYCSL